MRSRPRDIGQKRLSAKPRLWIDDVSARPLLPSDVTGELIENGGFEDGAPGLVPPGWATGRWDRPYEYHLPATRITRDESRRGKQSLEFVLGDRQPHRCAYRWLYASGCWRLEPDKKYVLSFWTKSDKEALIFATFLGPIQEFNPVAVRRQWDFHQIPVTITPEQETSPRCGFEETSFCFCGSVESQSNLRIWIDDVSLRQAAKTPASSSGR